nr:hypothetical protein [Rickettsia endosymbiont of Ceutorhynchus assimilis]
MPPRNDDSGSHATTPLRGNDIENSSHATTPPRNDEVFIIILKNKIV